MMSEFISSLLSSKQDVAHVLSYTPYSWSLLIVS